MILKLGGLFFVISVVFWLWAVFDMATTDAGRVRNLPKLGWALIVIFFFEVGALAWVLFGRPRASTLSGPGSSGGSAFGSPGSGSGSGSGRQAPGRSGGGGSGSGRSVPGASGPKRSGPIGPDDDPDFLRRL
jgi:hypothetical protein